MLEQPNRADYLASRLKVDAGALSELLEALVALGVAALGLAAAVAVVVSGVYWVVRPGDRAGTALVFWGAVAWWVGYLAFTKFGGLRLGPPAMIRWQAC